MVRPLHRKLGRDLRQSWGQVLSIALVVASGVSVWLASLSTHDTLRRAQAEFYAACRFADVFVAAEGAPEGLKARVESLPGVAAVETRLTSACLLDLPDMAEPVAAELVSLPDHGLPLLNTLALRGGDWPALGGQTQAVVSEAFAGAHGLRPGDSVVALLNGRRERIRITGLALSPEYVYAMGPGSPLPDNRRFGVLWMPRTSVAASLGLSGAFNSLALTLAPGASEVAVVRGLDHLLEPYGGRGAAGRRWQPSHRMVEDELDQLRVMASSVPLIFLGVTAFLLHLVVTRLVRVQREVIATLKALGFGPRPVLGHYLAFVAVIVALGLLLGVAFGAWQGLQMTRLYLEYFRFPDLPYRLDPTLVLMAGGVFLGVSVAAVAGPVREIFALQPAEAMRPAAPARFTPGRWDRGAWLGAFSPAGRLAVRGMMRRPWQTLLTSLGIALAMAVVILGLFWWDGIERVLQLQFHRAERAGATVAFREPVPGGAVWELARLPGVLAAEGQRTLTARLRAGHREEVAPVVGLPPEGRLRQLLDASGRVIPLPAEGLLLTRGLARQLQVRAGDAVSLEALEGRRARSEVRVGGLVGDWVGRAAYGDRRFVNRFMGEGDLVTSAALNLDGGRVEPLQTALKERPQVAGLAQKAQVVRTFRRLAAEHIRIMVVFLVGFACVIAVGVVFNSIRIAFSERAWELASLRVLGFTRREVARLLFGELGFEIALALPVGWAVGYGLGYGALGLMQSQVLVLPFVMAPATAAWAALTVVASGLVSAGLVKRRIDRLDLVAVLKTRE